MGKPRTPESIEKQRESIKRRIAEMSPEDRERWNANMRKAVRTEECRSKMREANLKRFKSQEERDKLSVACKAACGIGTEANERRRETVRKHYANLTPEQRQVFVNAGIKGSQASTNRFRTYGKSSYEQEIVDWLDGARIPYERNNRSVLGGKELDFYFPYANLAIEFNGGWYHSIEGIMKLDARYGTFETACRKHFDKSFACNEKGIFLFHIWEWQWSDKDMKELIKNHLMLMLTGLQKYVLNTTVNAACVHIGTMNYEDTSNFALFIPPM